jgi:hypothetical protein
MNDFLLNLFTSSNNSIRPFMMFPNLSNGIVHATDACGLIAIPENELSLKYGTNVKYPNAQKIIDDFNKNELLSVRVNVAELAKELTKARIEVDMDSVKCKECSGSGDVEFEYEDKKGDSHYIDGDCPICEGKGSDEKDSKFARISLDMIQKEDGTQVGILIDELYFHPFQLYRLLMVALVKKVDEFEIHYSPFNYGQVMSYFGNVSILVMLMRRDS